MKLYKIRDWAALFENNRSRTVKDLAWVPIPNRHDGENFSIIMAHEKGAEIFAAWVLLLQVASRCQPRGSLLRDNKKPHTPATLSIKTRAPENWFILALNFLENETDWLEIVPNCQVTDSVVRDGCQPPDEERREGNERIHTHTADAHIPTWIEVKAKASMTTIPETSAKSFYDYHEGNQLWINQHGRLINWEVKMKAWSERDRTHPKKVNGHATPAKRDWGKADITQSL